MYTDARSSVGARNSVPSDTGESTTRSTLKPRNILMNGVAETSKKSKLSFLPLLLLNDSVRLGERRRIDSLSAIRRKCWMDTIINGEEKFAKIFFGKGVNARNEKSALSLSLSFLFLATSKFIVFKRARIRRGRWLEARKRSLCVLCCEERLRSACFEHNKTKVVCPAIGWDGHFPEHHFRSRKVLPRPEERVKS